LPVTIPATGSGTATPIVSTDNVTADSSQVQNVQLAGVSGGVLTRVKVAASGQLYAAEVSSTGTESNVASSATDITILASNASRVGATIYNDSTAVLYVLLSNATSTTSLFTVKVASGGYYEVPFGYTGIVTGFWASATGNARVTEMT
jgi:hypothetical protein